MYKPQGTVVPKGNGLHSQTKGHCSSDDGNGAITVVALPEHDASIIPPAMAENDPTSPPVAVTLPGISEEMVADEYW